MIEYEVPSICETQVTGRIGGALLMKGRVSYRVNLVNGQAPVCLKDGTTVTVDHNATMLKLVKSVRKFFSV